MVEAEQRPSERTDSLRTLAALIEYAGSEARDLRLPFLSYLLTMVRVELAQILPNEPASTLIIIDADDQDVVFRDKEEKEFDKR
jgi:hypothetical protein